MDGIAGTQQRHLQTPWMKTAVVMVGWIKTAGQLPRSLGDKLIGGLNQILTGTGCSHLNIAIFKIADLPALRCYLGEVTFNHGELNSLVRAISERNLFMPWDIGRIK